MKRRSFLGLTGLAAAIGLPAVAKGCRNRGSALSTNTGVNDPVFVAPDNELVQDARKISARTNGLLPEYTLDNFVIGKANELAVSAGLQVADYPGTSPNPLVLYGNVGLGKTHLVHAIGNSLATRHPSANVRYRHAGQFMFDVLSSYDQDSIDEYMHGYRSLDLLLIDDIQFFQGKNRSQQEFYYVLNALVEAHKQVIVTSDINPRHLRGIRDGFYSHFNRGLILHIKPSGYSLRVALLRNKAESMGVRPDEGALSLIATHIRSNTRELEGALKSVIWHSRVHGRDISIRGAQDALAPLLS